MDRGADLGETPFEAGGSDCNDALTSQGAPRGLGALGSDKRQEGPPPEPSERVAPRHLDFAFWPPGPGEDSVRGWKRELWPWVGMEQETEAALDFSELRVPETAFLLRPCLCRAVQGCAQAFLRVAPVLPLQCVGPWRTVRGCHCRCRTQGGWPATACAAALHPVPPALVAALPWQCCCFAGQELQRFVLFLSGGQW